MPCYFFFLQTRNTGGTFHFHFLHLMRFYRHSHYILLLINNGLGNIMAKKLTKYSLIILPVFLFASCENPYKEHIIVIASNVVDFESETTGGREGNNAFAGKYYTHCDGNSQFSSGFYFP